MQAEIVKFNCWVEGEIHRKLQAEAFFCVLAYILTELWNTISEEKFVMTDVCRRNDDSTA